MGLGYYYILFGKKQFMAVPTGLRQLDDEPGLM